MPSGDWSYLKLSLTEFRLISSETLETLRPNFPAMNRRDFFFFKNLSIFLRSNKTKCLKFSINLILECSDSKVNLHPTACHRQDEGADEEPQQNFARRSGETSCYS